MASIPTGVQLALAVVLTAPFPMCASGMTPVAAVLVAKGLSPGAALVGLLLAPMLSATLLDALAQREGRAWSRLLFLTVLACAFMSAGVVFALPGVEAQALSITPWISLPATGVALWWALTSLWRRGVRGYVAQIVSPLAHVHPGGHLHGPGCTHGCGHDHTPGARAKAPVARIALPLSAVDLIPPRRP